MGRKAEYSEKPKKGPGRKARKQGAPQRFQLQVEDIAFGFEQLLSVLRTNGLNVCVGLRTAN